MGDYDFLFPELRDEPWTPGGARRAPEDGERAEDVRQIRALAGAMYGRPMLEGRFPAAYTFFGQLVTHDLTFDARGSLHGRALDFPNHRTARFDLDCIYGAGPRVHPHLYEQADPRRLCMGRSETGERDLPRNLDRSLDATGGSDRFHRRRVALIGDPRNDENVVLSQLHLAFLRFHNRQVRPGVSFAEAQRLTRLHYQWVLLHDYLATLCGAELLARVERNRDDLGSFRRSWPPFVPVEFAFAAFRFGHSMVGPGYLLNDAQSDAQIAPFPLYDFHAMDWPSRDAAASRLLDGQRALPPRWTVQWDLFLCGTNPRAQRAQRIDTRIDDSLRHLPMPDDRDLALRTLLRGWRLGLPSGQRVASHLGLEERDELVSPNGDPLWIYVLREAEAEADTKAQVKAAAAAAAPADDPTPCTGNRLGPVGARIVAEVCVRMLEADPDSLLNAHRGWQPEAVAQGGSYTLRNFLEDAGAPITRDDWERAVSGEDASAL